MASRSRATVVVDSKIPEYLTRVEAVVRTTMLEAQAAMVVRAKAIETPRNTDALNDSIDMIEIVKVYDRFEGGIGASDWKANWYEKGTKAHSNKAKGVRRTSAKTGKAQRLALKGSGLGSGVKAYHYLGRGLYGEFKQFCEVLQSRLGKAA